MEGSSGKDSSTLSLLTTFLANMGEREELEEVLVQTICTQHPHIPNTSPNTGRGNLKITIMAPNTLSLVRHPKFVSANLNEPANLYLPKRPLFLSLDVCLSCNALQWSCINV